MAKTRKITAKTSTINREVASIIDVEYRAYAMYSLERALPNMIDGLKGAQRKALYTCLLQAKGKKQKVAALAGMMIAQAAYLHGDASASTTITNMAREYANNLPLLKGTGTLGTRLVPEPGSPRYIYAELNQPVFNKYFADEDILEYHEDPEIPEPKFYLPTIPWVFVNGSVGIATGFACTILPRDPKTLIEVCQRLLNNEEVADIDIPPHFSGFKGDVFRRDNNWWCRGKYHITSSKLEITEVPIQVSREEYIELLNDILEKHSNLFSKYEDKCDRNGFHFVLYLKGKGHNQSSVGSAITKLSDKRILSLLKLEKRLSENITVINERGVLQEFSGPVKLIEQFLDYQQNYTLVRRIEYHTVATRKQLAAVKETIRFLGLVQENKITFKDKSKSVLSGELITIHEFTDTATRERLLAMPFSSLTKDNLDKLGQEKAKLRKQLVYWKRTTPSKQLKLNLDKLAG